MNISDVATLISSVGFPIACCVYLLWQNERQRDTFEKLSDAITELKFTILEERKGK